MGLIPCYFWDQFQFVIDHPETIRSTVVKLILPYQRKFSCGFYTNNKNMTNIRYKISRDTECPVLSGLNKDAAADSSFYLHGLNDKKTEEHKIVTNI